MTKVSYIIPAYKRRFLEDAISSILAQTYRDIEVVVVDDKSPQGLRDVVSKFNDPRLHYYQNDVNIGAKDLVGAWNKALSYASGEWVICAGDDDVYNPTFVEELLKLSEKYPDVDALHCRLGYIDEDGHETGCAAQREEYETQLGMLRSCVAEFKFQVISDFMYRRTKLLEIGGYAKRPRAFYSDWETAILMAENGAAYSSRVLALWRSSTEQVSAATDDISQKIDAAIGFRNWAQELLLQLGCKDASLKPEIRQLKSRIDLAQTRGICGFLNAMSLSGVVSVLPKLPWWALWRLPYRAVRFKIKKILG